MSLEKTFFNVATNRSKYNTVIVCDESMLKNVNMDADVRTFLEKVQKEQ